MNKKKIPSLDSKQKYLSTQPYQPYVYGFRIIKRHQDIFNNSKSLELDQNPTMSAFVHLTNVSLLDVLIHETFMELRSNCVVDKTFVLEFIIVLCTIFKDNIIIPPAFHIEVGRLL